MNPLRIVAILVMVDGLKALDPNRPIREADINRRAPAKSALGHISDLWISDGPEHFRSPASRETNGGRTR
jgi:hypothetical protein